MDWIKIVENWKAETEKVSAALGKAAESGRMCEIERDIVLERLRKVYDGIRQLDIDAPEAEKNTPPEAPPEPAEAVEKNAPAPYAPEPFAAPAIDREVIESLYDSPELNIKKEELPAENPAQPVEPAEEPVESPLEPAPEVVPAPPEPSGKVLNDTFENDVFRDIASTLSAQMIAGPLSKKLGLNDRLMLLNDLFDHDEALCAKTLDDLDVIDNINDAYIYLYEHFTLDENREGVRLLISLLEAKFS